MPAARTAVPPLLKADCAKTGAKAQVPEHGDPAPMDVHFLTARRAETEPRPVPVLRAASRPSGLSGPSLWWSWSYEIQLDQRANECTAYSKLTGDNKELLIIPGANHTEPLRSDGDHSV